MARWSLKTVDCLRDYWTGASSCLLYHNHASFCLCSAPYSMTYNGACYYMDTKINCCIFWPAFGCCALRTLVEIVIFSAFAAKNLKKARNLQQIFAKNRCPQLRTTPKCLSTPGENVILWQGFRMKDQILPKFWIVEYIQNGLKSTDVLKCWKGLFQPANGMPNTLLLIEVHNISLTFGAERVSKQIRSILGVKFVTVFILLHFYVQIKPCQKTIIAL